MLWFRGYVYRSVYFDRLGLSVDQFPITYPETVTIGVTSWLTGLMYVLMVMVVALLIFMIFVIVWRSASWQFFGKGAQENAKHATKDAAVLLVDILVKALLLLATLFTCFLMVLLFSHADGERMSQASWLVTYRPHAA